MKKVPATILAQFILSVILAATAGGPVFPLTQPNGTVIPAGLDCSGGEPVGIAAVFACSCIEDGICNIGDPCPSEDNCPDGQNGTCECTLYHVFNDNTCIPSQRTGIDPVDEASILPETFNPAGTTLNFKLSSRGVALFQDAFGWYNVTGSAPGTDDLHLIFDCSSAQGSTAVLNIDSEPAWLGGEIGFFLVTPESHSTAGACADGDCCATTERLSSGEGRVYYSQRSYNPDSAGLDSVIHLLIYQSRIAENRFYFAWEDLYNSSGSNFTDIVVTGEGIDGIWFTDAILNEDAPNICDCGTGSAGGGLTTGMILIAVAVAARRKEK